MLPRWLPNAISCARIALVPVWVIAAEYANRTAEAGGDPDAPRLLATLVFATIGLSDLADGYLARRYGLATPLGATLDAIADKLAQVAGVSYFALRLGPAFAPIPIWFLVLLIVRDLVLAAGCTAIRSRCGRVEVVHRPHGKAASLLLFVLLLAFSTGHGHEIGPWLLAAIAVLVLWSTALYFRDGLRQVG